MWESIWQDVRFAIRGLRRTPVFTMVAVASLAFGIGANTTIFSFVNTVLLKMLPVPDPQELVRIEELGGKQSNLNFSYPFVEGLNKRAAFFDGVAGRFPVRVHVTGERSTEELQGELVTGSYFGVLRVRPALGRLLTEEDVRNGTADPVCVISYETWQRRFQGDRGMVGRTLRLNRQPYRVVGVSQRGFSGVQYPSRMDLQIPVSRMADFMRGFFTSQGGSGMWKMSSFTWLEPLGRLKPGVTRAEAQGRLQVLARDIKLQTAEARNLGTVKKEQRSYRLLEGSQGVNYERDVLGDPLSVLMGIVGLVLVIACANLASWLLARSRTREQEFAVRLALGAGRSRVIRQLMVESMAIASGGGLLGLLVSTWLTESLLAYLNVGRAAEFALRVRMDGRVVAFSIGLAILTAILFGLAPAWQSAQTDILSRLQQSSRSASASAGHSFLRRVTVVAQLALSMCLLLGAGLLTRTLRNLETADLGFKPEQVLVISLSPEVAGYKGVQVDNLFDRLLERVRSLPDVAAASYSTVSPLDGSSIANGAEIPGRPAKASDLEPGDTSVSPGYFSTLRQPLLAGRDISVQDQKKSLQVAVVDEHFVAQYLPGLNPIGRSFRRGESIEIVGVVKNTPYATLRAQRKPLIYLPAKQTVSSGYSPLVRARGDAENARGEVERTIRSVDKNVPVSKIQTLQTQIEGGLSSERALGLLSALFALLATGLCAVGVYGIIAYGVTSRTREIGIRLALGASRSSVAGLFLREMGWLVGAGTVIGLPLALGSAYFMRSLLYGLQPYDPAILAAITAILVLTGFGAIILPVRQAVRTEPGQALRNS